MKVLAIIMAIMVLLPSILPASAVQKNTSLYLVDAIFPHGTTQKLTAILTDLQGNPLCNKLVKFYVNTSVGWHYLGSAFTNGSGVAEYEIYVSMPNGTYLFKATFEGDSEYLPSTDIAQISVVNDVLILPILIIVVKAIAVAVATYVVQEYVLKPYVFTPVANWVKQSSLPYKEYYDDPEELQLYFDLALLAVDAYSALKSGFKAAFQFTAAQEATGKAIGGHMRWFWYYATKFIGDFTGILTDRVIDYVDKKVYENEAKHLTEEEKSKIKEGISPFVREANDAYLQKLASSTFLDAFIIDPIVGYSETIRVPDNVKRMRIYLGWNISLYTENFFVLKDPAGNTVLPQINVTYPTDPEATKVAVELSVWDPPAGNWTLWLDGDKLPNERVVMFVQFDKVFEILPFHLPANPGYKTILKAIFTNYGNAILGASLSFADVPEGWSVESPPYCPVVFPNSSSTIDISVTPPPDVRYGVSTTIKAIATIDSDSYVEPFTVYITPLKEIEDGIVYLHERQLSDGSWQHNVGITSLALLGYLNAGYDENVEDVKSAINYILSQVKSDGSICTSLSTATYETSLAMLALIATHNSTYDPVIERAKDWLLNSQWDESCLWGSVGKDNWYYGGFGYGNYMRPDLSNTQFALIALDAAGVPKDDLVWAKAQVFLARCQNRQENVYIPELDYMVVWNTAYNKYDDGGFVYYPGASLAGDVYSYGSMTGAGIWSLRLCGVPNEDPRVKSALNWVKSHYTWDGNPGMPDPTSMQYYYYLSMSKALIMTVGIDGQIDGHYWYDDMVKKLISLRKQEGYWVNSNGWAWENIPELITAYVILSMEYRYIPVDIKRLSWITFILHSCADLHIYDPLGRHIGRNYQTGEVENQIPGAIIELNEVQNITIPQIEAGNYRVLILGIGSGEYNFTIRVGIENELIKEVSYRKTISKGETHEADVVVAMITWLTVATEEPKVSNEMVVPSATGAGNVSFIPDKGSITELVAINESDLPRDGKPPLRFPFGFFGFKIVGINTGELVNVTVVFPENVSITAEYWKYHVSKGWYQIPILSNDGDNIVVVQLIDGGVGDDDGIENGIIVDAGGLGVVTWEYIFQDSMRGTELRIDLDDKLFQFITPDKDYGIRKAAYMRQCGRAIIIRHCDSELRLMTVAVDTKLDFCVAIAWDVQTGKHYFLIDKAGKE